MNKDDLKAGMFVRTASNNVYMVVDEKLNHYDGSHSSSQGVLIGKGGWTDLQNYDYNLYSLTDSDYDIEKVYEPPAGDINGMFDDCRKPYLVWERCHTEWNKVKKDTRILVQLHGGVFRRLFAEYDEQSNTVKFYAGGACSWTNGDERLVEVTASNAVLADEEDY